MVDQGCQIRVCDEYDAAAITTITAVRAAARNVLLAAKAHAAVTPGTGLDRDFDFVDEHRSLGLAKFLCQGLFDAGRDKFADVAPHARHLPHNR